MMNKRQSPPNRTPLTTEELERLTIDDFMQLKLTDDEKLRLREINKAREQERLERVPRIYAEQVLLLEELRATGLQLDTVSELISRSVPYPQAIPILLKHLVMPYSDVARETISRSLAVPELEVQKAWPILVEEYCKAPMGTGIKYPGDTKEYRLAAKDGLACAIAVAVTEETLDELIDLVKDRKNGESRILLLSVLKKRRNKNPKVKQVLEELIRDPELEKEISSWRK